MRKRVFTDEEIEIIKLVPLIGTRKVSRILKTGDHQVRRKAVELNIPTPSKRHRYNNPERERIIAAIRNFGIGGACKFLNMPYEAVAYIAQRWKVRRAPLEIKCSPVQAAYLAGIVDGEGNIGLQIQGKDKLVLSPRIQITNSDVNLIEYCETFGCFRKRTVSRKTGYKDVLVLTVRRLYAVSFLTAILPYLIVKKKPAELMLEYLQLCEGRLSRPRDNPRMLEIALELRSLYNYPSQKPEITRRLEQRLAEISQSL